MDEGLTIESFAAEMANAGKPEHPAAADSGPADVPAEGEDSSLEGAQQDAEAQAEEAQAEGDTEGQSEQPAEDSDQAKEPVHKWTTANGEAYEVAESELRAGYLRQQDYTQKAQQVAEWSRQSQAQIQQQAQQQVQVLNQVQQGLMYLGGLDAQIQSLRAQNLPSADLMVERMRAEQQLNGTLGQFAQSFAQQTRSQEQAAVSAAEQHLASRFPGITQKDVGQAFAQVHKLSPTEQELNLIRTHPHLAEMAMYAGKWLDLQAKKPEVQNKVRKLPSPTTKPRSPVPTSKTEAALKAINSRSTFSTAQFAELLKAAG